MDPQTLSSPFFGDRVSLDVSFQGLPVSGAILPLVRLQAYALHLPFYVMLVMQTQALVLRRPALAPP